MAVPRPERAKYILHYSDFNQIAHTNERQREKGKNFTHECPDGEKRIIKFLSSWIFCCRRPPRRSVCKCSTLNLWNGDKWVNRAENGPPKRENGKLFFRCTSDSTGAARFELEHFYFKIFTRLNMLWTRSLCSPLNLRHLGVYVRWMLVALIFSLLHTDYGTSWRWSKVYSGASSLFMCIIIMGPCAAGTAATVSFS